MTLFNVFELNYIYKEKKIYIYKEKKIYKGT